MRVFAVLFLSAIALRPDVGVLQTPRVPALEPVAVVKHPPLGEVSGIVKSRRYADTFWVHNDGGDTARLFAIRADGTVIMPPWLAEEFFTGEPVEGKEPYGGVRLDGAANSDWEDIAIDGDTLYVADMGNNGNARRDLGVYVLTEPNPEATSRARIIKWIPVEYPDQKGFPGEVWHFDCEAVFVREGKLHFLTKHRASGSIGVPETGANLYRLDSTAADRVNVLTKLDGVEDLGGWVTAADLFPDGELLAVLCQYPVQSVWLFDAAAPGGKMLSHPLKRYRFSNGKQCEAICFLDGERLLMANEQRELFVLKPADFTPAGR